ncbi:MAG: nicotinate-nicotinamide nucleotide adenylyltransferase [Deltaproteobacteria bacterium]|nr:nicotinate-nicotinamide nucleotide adenylyltransferase [Deltaproteobacteria bacterium]
MKNNSINIGLFGSSFNPPHLGHFAVIKDLIRQKIFYEIWLIPVYAHPFDKKLLNFEDRLILLNLFLRDLNEASVKITTVERDLNNKPSYTYDTIVKLREHLPHAHFTLILGSDTKNDINLDKWYRYDDLKKIAGFYFVPRKGFEDSPYPDVSSSQIRGHLAKNESIDHLTTKSVADYLARHHLYRAGF